MVGVILVEIESDREILKRFSIERILFGVKVALGESAVTRLKVNGFADG